MKRNKRTALAKLAFRFVLTIGIVNLFADLTYEGARSITGPFLGSLGASATAIGLVVGFGELLGYSLRSISGFLADKTHKYCVIAFVGYAIAWFVGSATLGFLYDKSIASLIVVSVVLQLFALPVFLWARTQDKTVTD